MSHAIKTLGFEYAMRSGTTLAVADIPFTGKDYQSLKAVNWSSEPAAV
jgi:hypothetical protein